MKKNVIILIFIFSFLSTYSQSFKEKPWNDKLRITLEQNLNLYTDYLSQAEWEKAVEMMYPGLFELTDKEKIIRSLENGTRGAYQKIRFQKPSNITIYPAYLQSKGKKYALIAYTNNFTITLPQKENEEDSFYKSRTDYIYHKLQKKYPDGKIIRSSQKGTFHVAVPKYMLAVYSPQKKSFTFIDFPPHEAYRETLKQIMDPDVTDYFYSKIIDGFTSQTTVK